MLLCKQFSKHIVTACHSPPAYSTFQKCNTNTLRVSCLCWGHHSPRLTSWVQPQQAICKPSAQAADLRTGALAMVILLWSYQCWGPTTVIGRILVARSFARSFPCWWPTMNLHTAWSHWRYCTPWVVFWVPYLSYLHANGNNPPWPECEWEPPKVDPDTAHFFWQSLQ